MLTLNQTAPDFTLPQDGGDDITLSKLRPSNVVLYFYPRDDTTGCTIEALDFTKLLDAFKSADTVVLGVSRDTVAKHSKFRDKFQLTVPLLADVDGKVCELYGTWVEKMNYGKAYMGIERTTFLINSDGIITNIWNKVRAKGHAEQVLDFITTTAS